MKYFIVINILFLIVIFFKYRYALYILQNNKYNKNNCYLKWINNNFNKVFLSYDLVFFIYMIVAYFIKNPYVNLLILGVLFLGAIVFFFWKDRINLKGKKIAFNNRIKRIIFILFVVHFIYLLTIYINFDMDRVNIYNIVFILNVYFSYFVIFVANFILGKDC